MISIIIKTKNAEDTLCNTLESVKNLGEIILIDEHSTDDTVEIAREYKAKIIYTLACDFDSTFNETVSQSKYDWILTLEQDEIISKSVIEQIQVAINSQKKNAFLFEQKTFYFNKEIKSQKKTKLLRLYKKNETLKPSKLKNGVILKYKKADIFLDITKALDENRLKVKNENKKADFLKPIKVFFLFYLIKQGFKDGLRGLIFAYFEAQKEFIFQTMLYEKEMKKGQEENDI